MYVAGLLSAQLTDSDLLVEVQLSPLNLLHMICIFRKWTQLLSPAVIQQTQNSAQIERAVVCSLFVDCGDVTECHLKVWNIFSTSQVLVTQI